MPKLKLAMSSFGWFVGGFLVFFAVANPFTLFFAYLSADRAVFFAFHDVLAIPFDRKVWLDSWHRTGHWECTRLQMVKDLIAKHRLIGMSRQQVIDLLGDNYATHWAAGGYYPSEVDSMNYILGETTPLHSEDPWYLCLKLDHGTVTEYRLWEED
jgi:hypothetical protein